MRVDAELLAAYLTAVHAQTIALPRDRRAPTTSTGSSTSAGTRRSRSASRLVSVVNDDSQHLGQAAYVRGLLA